MMLKMKLHKIIDSLAKQETKIVKQIYAVAGVIIAAVGLMIKFL